MTEPKILRIGQNAWNYGQPSVAGRRTHAIENDTRRSTMPTPTVTRKKQAVRRESFCLEASGGTYLK